ncbi:hypothetical protein V8C43DRAFT_289876 [Trichoderma afarasin]
MDSRYSRQDFPQLATTPSSNFKWAGSGNRWTSKPHKARGITEVSNRNTISKDSTKSNELCELKLRNRDTISKDLTQSDGPFKPEMQNRAATSKDKIENDDKARPRGTSTLDLKLRPIIIGPATGDMAVHPPSPVRERQMLQQ